MSNWLFTWPFFGEWSLCRNGDLFYSFKKDDVFGLPLTKYYKVENPKDTQEIVDLTANCIDEMFETIPCDFENGNWKDDFDGEEMQNTMVRSIMEWLEWKDVINDEM